MSKEFLLLLRDRQSLLVLFAMPLLLVVTVSTALRDVYLGLTSSGLSVAVVDHDESDGSRHYVEHLLRQPSCDFTLLGPGDDAGRGDELPPGHQARVIIPPGFGAELEAMARGRASRFEDPLRYAYDPVLERVYESLLQGALASALEQSLLDSLTGLLAERGLLPDSAADGIDRDDLNLFAADADAAIALPTPLQQTVPAWSLFAMFFIALPLSASLIHERRSGLLRRLRTYPVRPLQLLAAKLLPYWVVNLVQFGLLILVGLALAAPLDVPPLSLGEHAWVLAPITFCVALASTSFGLAVAVLARTDNQASALGAFSSVLMAVTGGVMIPVFVMPAPMQLVARASPMYWAHQAYLDVFLRGADFADVLPWLGAILGFAALCLTVGVWRFRWD